MDELKRGQIYYAKLPIYRDGHQVIKPILVIQNNKYNEICDEVLAIPINKRINKSIINDLQMELDDFKKVMPNSVFLISKLLTIKKKNINGFIIELDKKSIKLINRKLKYILGLK